MCAREEITVPTSQTSNWNRQGIGHRPTSSNTAYRRAGRKVPCAKCGAEVSQWCISGDGRPRVSNHQERNVAAGLSGARRPATKLRPMTSERLAEYEAMRSFGPCRECGVSVGEPCLGKRGTPTRSCHLPRYLAWKNAPAVDRAG